MLDNNNCQSENITSKIENDCWANELPSIPGLVLDEEVCDYWLNKEDFLERLDQFILNTREQSKLLNSMMADNNITDMKKLLHKLKGSVKLYGAKRLFKSIQEFEDVFKTDNHTALLKIKAEFDNAVFEITT